MNQANFRFFKFILVFAALLLTNIASSNTISCGNFYSKAYMVEQDLKELRFSFNPLANQKQNYLEDLEKSTRDFFNIAEYKRASNLLYQDIDYDQFKIVKNIDRLIEMSGRLNLQTSWERHKALLVKLANNQLSPDDNYWGNNPFENLADFISMSREISLFIVDFKQASTEWKRTKRGLSEEKIQWMDMKTIEFLYAYSSVANCHTQFMFFETNDVLKKNKK